MLSKAMWVLWPSFLTAVAAVGAFFSLLDPREFWLFGEHLEISRLGAYTIGFFGFWAVGAGSSALTLFLTRGADEVNRAGP
jgi:hypothetical protein